MTKLAPAGLSILVLLAAPIGAQASVVLDRWMVVSIASAPLGYYHERQVAEPDGTVNTDQATLLVVNRMGTKVRIASELLTHESQDGTLRSFDLSLQTSAAPVVMHDAAKAGVLTITTSSGGKSYDRTQRLNAPLYGPFGQQLAAANLHKAGDSVEYLTFVPDVMAVGLVHQTVTQTHHLAETGALEVSQTVEGVPGKEELTITPQGVLLSETAPTPFGTMQMFSADERTARLAATGGTLNSNAYARTIAVSNVRLPDPRKPGGGSLGAAGVHDAERHRCVGRPARRSDRAASRRQGFFTLR